LARCVLYVPDLGAEVKVDTVENGYDFHKREKSVPVPNSVRALAISDFRVQ